MWTCPNCNRSFLKENQPHSCKIYPEEKHLTGKANGALLYEKLKRLIKHEVGTFKVESLPCCIHFVHKGTFMAVYVLRSKLKIHLATGREIKSPRILKYTRLSASRYLYELCVKTEAEMDTEFINWVRIAYSAGALAKPIQVKSR